MKRYFFPFISALIFFAAYCIDSIFLIKATSFLKSIKTCKISKNKNNWNGESNHFLPDLFMIVIVKKNDVIISTFKVLMITSATEWYSSNMRSTFHVKEAIYRVLIKNVWFILVPLFTKVVSFIPVFNIRTYLYTLHIYTYILYIYIKQHLGLVLSKLLFACRFIIRLVFIEK